LQISNDFGSELYLVLTVDSADYCSGPSKVIGPVSVCVYVWTIAVKLCDL